MHRFDRDRSEGEVFIYIQEDPTSKPVVDHTPTPDIERIFIELNLKK